MPYLNTDEFIQLSGVIETPDNIEYLIKRASAELDALTRFYYVHKELTDDWVSNQFKLALVEQVLFYVSMGATSVEEMNNQPDSVRIGDTTVTQNRTITNGNSNVRQTSISKDATNLLMPTGLLYRGAGGYGV